MAQGAFEAGRAWHRWLDAMGAESRVSHVDAGGKDREQLHEASCGRKSFVVGLAASFTLVAELLNI